MCRVKVALVSGLVLFGAALAVTLLKSPPVVARTNRSATTTEGVLAIATHSAKYCQAGELLPRGTSAVRILMNAAFGPRVRVTISSGKKQIGGGQSSPGWVGGSVTVPIQPIVETTVRDTTICFSARTEDETLKVVGGVGKSRFPTVEGRRRLRGTAWIEYLRPDHQSWLSLTGGIAHRLGLGRAPGGSWVSYAALALMLAVAALASSLLVRESR